MIKRRFYRFEHGSRDAPSESSSSSDSEVEVEAADDSEIEEEDEEVEEEDEDDDGEDKEGKENVALDAREKGDTSSSSGYESEDSSVNEVNLDSSGLPTSDDDVAAQNILSGGEGISLPTIVQNSPKKDVTDLNMAECVLKRKSVFKCRLCPRIVCLSEETLKAHLNSKKHARSENLLKEGRLKLMLNDDGEIEGEMHSENPEATADSDQEAAKPNKKRKGQGKPGKRQREKKAELGKGKPSRVKREKRRKDN